MSYYSRRRKQGGSNGGGVKNTRRHISLDSLVNNISGRQINNLTVTGTITGATITTTSFASSGNAQLGSATVSGATTTTTLIADRVDVITLNFNSDTSGDNRIIVPDNLSNSLRLHRSGFSGDNMLVIDTTSNRSIDMRMRLNFETFREITVPDTSTEALVFRNVSNTQDFLVINSSSNRLETIPIETTDVITTNITAPTLGSIVIASDSANTNAIDINTNNGGIELNGTTNVTLNTNTIELNAGPGGIQYPRATITQTGTITSDVTINSVAGRITTVSSTLISGGSVGFTVNNDRTLADSVVILTINEYNGTTGIPMVSAANVLAASFDIIIYNVDGTDALNDVIDIAFVLH